MRGIGGLKGFRGPLLAFVAGRYYTLSMRNEEGFLRVVGRRKSPPLEQLPSSEARQSMTRMANYRTCAPKGIFIYRSHEEANADRERWLLDAMIAKHKEHE